MSEAEWRPIAEGLYEVSSDGRVRRVGRDSKGRPVRGGELKLQRVWTGYLHATLCVGGKSARRYAHALVAEAFIGPKPEGAQVNHINGRKDDNRRENLEYVTRSENMRHAARIGLLHPARGERHMSKTRPDSVPRGEQHPHAKLTEDRARAIRAEWAAGGITQRELAERHGVTQSNVSRLLAGQSWKHCA